MAGYISRRAEVVKDWSDFLNKYMNMCNADEYDEVNNPGGYINLGTAVNNMCNDIILPRLCSPEVWACDSSLVQYREGYGIMRLRKALANVITEFFETHEPVNPENLFCVTGVTSCIDLLVHCIADPGDVILAPTPIYGRIYTDFKQRSQVDMWPIHIITKDNKETTPRLTLEKVEAAYSDAISQHRTVRGIFLTNPSNPLGDVYSPELLMEILQFCKERQLHAIIDEVYALSVFDDASTFHSVLRFESLPDRQRTHVLYGISKDFGIAGLRIGAIHTEQNQLQNCVMQLSFYQNIPFPVMGIAATFLEDLEWLRGYIATNRTRMREKYRTCRRRLRDMGLNVRESPAAFFLWVDFGPISGSKNFEQEGHFFHYLLEKCRVYAVPGKELFCAQPGWFRLVFTAFPDHVDEGLNRIAEVLKIYRPPTV